MSGSRVGSDSVSCLLIGCEKKKNGVCTRTPYRISDGVVTHGGLFFNMRQDARFCL